MSWTRDASDETLVQVVGSGLRLEMVYQAQAELARRANAPAYTNLYQWEQELAAGLRGPDTFDELWRAACEEANAMESFSRNASLEPSPRAYDTDLDDDLPF